MAGNILGEIFKVVTWGESHGPAIGSVIDGCPPQLQLSEEIIQKELDKRRPGDGQPGTTPRKEPDKVQILSGVFEGFTTGAPISLVIWNQDAKSKSYDHLKDIFRPGHGDFTYYKKYGIRDYRGGGRSSGRETAARVAAGAVAQLILNVLDIKVVAFTRALAGVTATKIDLETIEQSPYFCPDSEACILMEESLRDIREKGDSAGGIVEIRVKNCPAGLGEPVFDKLDADLARALMSIGAVKSVEIGRGIEVAKLTGSQNNDEITPYGFITNNAGGILGGISNGDEIVCRVAIKPIPSISMRQKTINTRFEPADIVIFGRHDSSAIPRIVPVCQAMARLVIADHLLRQITLKGFNKIEL
jgi:chorismate synthase